MKISYITPTLWDRLDYINIAGESLLQQTETDIEWIIVSNKPCPIQEQFMGKYANINVKIIQDDYAHSVSRARNIGIMKAKGDNVAFLDDDDAKYGNFGEVMLKHIGGISSVICSQDVVDGVGKIIGEHCVNPQFDIDSLFTNPVLYFTNELLINRNDLISIGMFDEMLTTSEDYDLFARVFRDLTTEYAPFRLSAYRKHDDNMSANTEIQNNDTHYSLHYIYQKYKREIVCGRCNKLIYKDLSV